MPNLFSAIGFADTRPLEKSRSKVDPINRRVEILILKNIYKDEYENTTQNVINIPKSEQDRIQRDREEIIEQVEKEALTPEARRMLAENRKKLANRQKSDKLSKKNKQLYINIENEANKENTGMPKIENRTIELKSSIPEDEDFGL